MQISAVQPVTLLDYPNKVACILFVAGCNFRCGFCHNPEFVLPQEIKKISHSFLTEDIFFKFLEKRHELLEAVVITGGEPTMMPDLEDFIKKIKDKYDLLVKLDTNGGRPEVTKKLIEIGLIDYVAMDIKTSLDNYSDLVGQGGDPEKIKQSIELLMQGNVDYEFRSTLIKEVHSREVLEKMAEMIKGACKLYLQTFRPGYVLDKRFEKYNPFFPTEMDIIADEIFAKKVKKVFVR